MGGLGRCAPIERAALALERLQQLAELLEHLVSEACTDFARVHELPLVVIAHQERAGISAALALPLEPPADYQLLAHPVLELDPNAAAPPRLVARVELLAHDAFEARSAAGLTPGPPPSLLVRHR